MKMSVEVIFLLPVLAICLLLAGGCASAGAGGGGAGPVRVNRVNYRGWEDAILMTNGDVVVVIVPQIARIMKYATVDGENLLWVNEKLTPEVTGSEGLPDPSARWINYGGYRMWPAPEDAWKKPVPWELDRGPSKVEITPEGVVRLTGMPSAEFGMRYDREIRLAATGSRLELTQSVVNVGDKPYVTAVWDVTEIKPDCTAFVPLGPGARYRMTERGGFKDQWEYVSDMMILDPSGPTGKAFFSGPPGWLGCRRGGELYFKVFEYDGAARPDPETPREVYTCQDYIELEAVGPGAELQPGQRTTFTEAWYLMPADEEFKTDEDLAKAVRKRMEKIAADRP